MWNSLFKEFDTGNELHRDSRLEVYTEVVSLAKVIDGYTWSRVLHQKSKLAINNFELYVKGKRDPGLYVRVVKQGGPLYLGKSVMRAVDDRLVFYYFYVIHQLGRGNASWKLFSLKDNQEQRMFLLSSDSIFEITGSNTSPIGHEI